jgi:hypothetical protein
MIYFNFQLIRNFKHNRYLILSVERGAVKDHRSDYRCLSCRVKPPHRYAGRLPMNAVVFALIFLLLIEWFADRFAGWLAKRWSMSRGQDAILPITAR